MKLCPRCGAHNHDQAFNCHYCGIQFPQPSPVRHPQPPPQQIIHNNYYFNQSVRQPQKKKTRASKSGKNTIWKALGWLFVFPLMITLIAFKKKTRNWYIFAVVSWIVYLIIFGPWEHNSASTSKTRVKNAAPISQEQMIQTKMVEIQRSWTPTPMSTETISFTPMNEMIISIIPTAPIPAAAPAIVNSLPAAVTAACHPNYPDVCIPTDKPDINCSDISFKNFRWINSDPYKLDRNNDGICCEN